MSEQLCQAPPNPNIFRAFSGGNRLCPGMEFAKQEILIFMHRFLTTFRYVELAVLNEYLHTLLCVDGASMGEGHENAVLIG